MLKRIAIVLSLFLFMISCQPKGSMGTAKIGQKAPDFTLKNLDGTKVGLTTFNNKVVLLEFWATWCPPCKTVIPELVELDKKYIDKDFVLLAISVDEGRNVAKKLSRYATDNGITYNMLISDDLTSRSYGVTSIPVMFLLDKEHKIVKKYKGYYPDITDEISEQIERLL